MFLDKYIPAKVNVKSEVFALEVCLQEEQTLYYYSHLRHKNNKLDILANGTLKDKLQLPPQVLKQKLPVVVVINGKGVILKKIALTESAPIANVELIRTYLPALNLDDFCIQVYRQGKESAFITLCRKEQVNTILSELEKTKYELADILLGPAAIIGMQPLWSNFNTLPMSTHRAELTNNLLDVLTSFQSPQQEMVKLDTLQFESVYTLGFAAGLTYLLQRQIAENYPLTLNKYHTEHIEKNKFRFLLTLVVGIAFLLATGNVVFYILSFDRHNALETELSVYQGKYEQINQLLEDYQQNKNLIENAGVLTKNRLSEYADRIGRTLPEEVVLTDLYFNPKKENEENEDSLITFSNKNLVLKGNCSKSFIVNEWINVLKMQSFIKQVNLEKFVYNNQGVQPNFEIKLTTE